MKIPPLRERRDDIPKLVYHFLGVIYQENGLYATFSAECMAALTRYEWPGNIRELRNVVEKTALEAEGRVAQAVDIPQYVRRSIKIRRSRLHEEEGLIPILERIEAEEIRRAIELCGGSKIKAAQYLQIPKVRLYRKLKKYGIG